jgi:hypothetical protein
METVINESASGEAGQDRQPNRRLTADEQESARRILEATRAELNNLAGGDRELLFALRRYIFNRLIHDERGTPMQRRHLKQKKVAEQSGECAICRNPLPICNSILDRIVAVDGYTDANTRVLCPGCDGTVQAKRKFS